MQDQRVKNIVIDENTLKEINTKFLGRLTTHNGTIAENTNKIAVLTYIIRFDDKGYRVFTLEKLLEYFEQGKEIERIVFTLETKESQCSNHLMGTFMELRLDRNDPNGCFLTVTSDCEDWVNSSLSVIQDILDTCKSKYRWLRTACTPLVVQITGVVLLFITSLWATVETSPKLRLPITTSFVVCFLFFLLISSNIWTYLNQKIISFLNTVFPNIKFYRLNKDRFQWLKQGIIVSIMSLIIVGALGWGFAVIKGILNSFIV